MREKDGRVWDTLNEGWLVYGKWHLDRGKRLQFRWFERSLMFLGKRCFFLTAVLVYHLYVLYQLVNIY